MRDIIEAVSDETELYREQTEKYGIELNRFQQSRIVTLAWFLCREVENMKRELEECQEVTE